MSRRYLIMGTALMVVSPMALHHLDNYRPPVSYHINPVYAS